MSRRFFATQPCFILRPRRRPTMQGGGAFVRARCWCDTGGACEQEDGIAKSRKMEARSNSKSFIKLLVIVIVATVEIINFDIDIKASAFPRSNHFLCSDKPARWNYTNALHQTSRKRSQRCRSSADKLESTAREQRAHNVCARVLNFFQIARCDKEAGLVPAGCRQWNKRRFANADNASPELHASE